MLTTAGPTSSTAPTTAFEYESSASSDAASFGAPSFEEVSSSMRAGMGIHQCKLKREGARQDSCQNRPSQVTRSDFMISLAQTAVLLAAAVIAVSLFRLINLSSILGYVAAGLI